MSKPTAGRTFMLAVVSVRFEFTTDPHFPHEFFRSGCLFHDNFNPGAPTYPLPLGFSRTLVTVAISSFCLRDLSQELASAFFFLFFDLRGSRHWNERL